METLFNRSNICVFFRDGRLRIGDEIVNANGRYLRGLQSFERVQKLLYNFIDNFIDLVIAHDEIASVSDFCTKIKIDCGEKDTIHNVQQCYDVTKKGLSNSQRSHSSDSLNSLYFDGTQTTKPNEDINNIPLNLCSTSKSVMTPMITNEYKPVYANNHLTITVPKSNDEKWQILKKEVLALNTGNRSSLRNSTTHSSIHGRKSRSYSLLSQSPRLCSSRLSLFGGKSFKIDATDMSNEDEGRSQPSPNIIEMRNNTTKKIHKCNNKSTNNVDSNSAVSSIAPKWQGEGKFLFIKIKYLVKICVSSYLIRS